MRPIILRVISLLIVVTLNISLAACSTLDSASRVTILGPWTGKEEENFKRVLKAFELKTGIQFTYQGTRALNEKLISDIQEGTQHDIAILGGELAQYQRNGLLHALDDIIGPDREAYAEPWLELQRAGTDKLYGVVVKANLKSIIWFNPNHVPNPKPGTLDELIALSQNVAGPKGTPWCLGMGDTFPNSGWPGTDWIEDILLHQSGLETYRKWVSGELPWTSPEIRQAWMSWGAIIAGNDFRSALLTDFVDDWKPLFASPPGCFLHHQPSFIIENYQRYKKDEAGATPRPGADFDFFPFPEFSPQNDDPAKKVYEVTADMAVMFNDKEAARKLIGYLATDEAQGIWPGIPGSGAFSANKKVQYKDDVSRRIAATLTSANTLCYDASDLMQLTIRNAFNRAVLEYLSDPSQLNSLLEYLDRIREGVALEERTTFLPPVCVGAMI